LFALPPLARALNRRVVVLLLAVVAFTLSSIAIFVVWQGRMEQYAEDANARQMVTTRLHLLQASWQREAENIVTGIELQRITSQPPAIRWQSLRAWLVALGENISFDTVLVVDPSGRVVFAHGHESEDYAGAPLARQAAWYLNRQQTELHAVIRSTLWLGADSGRGEIIFLQPMQPSILQLISSDKRPLYLTSAKHLLAGSDAVRIRQRPGAEFELDEQRWRLIAAPIEGTSEAHFLIRLPANTPAWFMPVLIGALALGLLLALGIYLVLGRWGRELVRRIETLSQAAHAFGNERTANLPAARALLYTAKDKDDEIGALADTLESLMDAVYLREEENRAYLDTLNLLEEVVIELDLNGAIRRASSAWQRLRGWVDDTANALATPIKFHDCLHPDDAEQMQTVFDAIASREKTQITLRARLHGAAASDMPPAGSSACVACCAMSRRPTCRRSRSPIWRCTMP
jgi:PAS domain-containing protein